MSPKLERQRPAPSSHLVRRAEPIHAGDAPAAAERGDQDDTPAAPPATPPDGATADSQPTPRPRRPRQAANAGTANSSAAATAARPRTGRKPVRPAARDLVGPARQVIPRQALKADVPAELALVDRLHRYRLDHGVDIRDQVAIAVDEWLTGQGY